MPKPRLILFDIGSTLWSSPAEDPAALQHCYGLARAALLRVMNEAPSTNDLIDAVEGYFAEWEETWRQDSTLVQQSPTPKFVSEALARLDVSIPYEVVTEFTDAILDTSVFTAKVLPREPGMAESLAALHSRLKLACVSNAFMGAAVLDSIMQERGLGPYLDFTVSSCELGFRKPHPAIYQAASKHMGIEPSETIFVGDRLDADVEGPARLGMTTVLTHQYRVEDPAVAPIKPDFVIKHLSELVDVVDGMLKL